jgi:SanA protein
MKKKIIFILLFGITAILLPILYATHQVERAGAGRTYADTETIPHRKVGLLLGCSKHLSDGRQNLFFRYRTTAAAQLFHAGKVDYLIVSGDNSIKNYDEPSDMKNTLIERGVPTEKIYCDYAGFRTLDSVVRARAIFGQGQITVISQPFHNERAIYIAGHKGIDAIGLNAQEVDALNSARTRLREQLARVKTVLDLFVLNAQPKFLGSPVAIGP